VSGLKERAGISKLISGFFRSPVKPANQSMLTLSITKRLLHTTRTMSAAPTNAALRKIPAQQSSLNSLSSSGWILSEPTTAHGEEEGKRSLLREYKFKDFGQAWGFMSRVALQAEKLNVRSTLLDSLKMLSKSLTARWSDIASSRVE